MLNPRLQGLKDYPFQRLRNLLDSHKTPSNLKPINLSIGEPQHPFPAFVGELLQAKAGDLGQYPPLNGTAEFRAAVVAWLNRRYRLPAGMIDGERHVLPLAGTREGLFMLALAVVPESKAGLRPVVAMPDPFYQCYAGAAAAAGAEAVFLPATAENNFLPELDALDRPTLERMALFYLCTPANPQGTVADLDYLCRAIDLARRYDFVLAVDECYAEIYDEVAPPGGLEACARSRDLKNVVVFHSLSKRSSVPGLRSGFCAGDGDILAAFSRLRSYGAAGTPLPVFAAATALWRDEAHVDANRARYREKFNIAQSVIGNRYGFYRPAGGFYLWLDVGDGEAAAEALWRKAALRTLPGRYLSRENDDGGGARPGTAFPYLRIALVPDAATTREAMERVRDTL